MTALLDATTAAPSAPGAPTVTAVVVATDGAAGLDLLLTALSDQTPTPERVVILSCADEPASQPARSPESTGETARAGEPDGKEPRPPAPTVAAFLEGQTLPFTIDVVHTPPGMPLRSAVLSYARQAATDLLWLLPCGVIPVPDALAALLAPHRRSPLVAITGPKVLDSTDPHVLRSAGIQVTRSGRILAAPAPGEPDQRQYDDRRDVVAVPLAGSLVRTSVLLELGGWHSSFGDLGADLDLGWRSQLSGRRVELVPSARVLAARGLASTQPDSGAQRRAVRRVALVRASWWSAPFLALWILVSALLAGTALLLLKRPRPAMGELGDLGALDPVRWIAARWRTRTRTVVRRRHLRGLFVPAAAVGRHLVDVVSESVLPTRHGRSTTDADDRSTLVRALTHPGLLATVLVAGVVAAAGRTLGRAPLEGLSGGLVGGELLGGRADAASLWAAWSDGWTGAGLGHPGSGSPHLALLAAATALVDLVPGLGSLASPMGTVVAAFLLLSPVLAAMSGYLAARVLTANRWLRAAAAVAWATAGAAGPAYAQGRIGALAVLVLLPLVGSGLVLLARRDGTATAAWATGLGLAVLGSFAPAVASVLAAFALLLAVAGTGRAARWRAAVPAVIGPAALVLCWPGVLDDPRQLLTGPGLAQWGGSPLPDWQLALGHVGGDGSPLVWFFVPLAVLGVVGLVRGRGVRSVGTTLGLLALVSVLGVLAATRVHVADVPPVLSAPDASIEQVTPWAGQMVLVLTAALLGGAVHGLDGLIGAGRGRWARVARTVAGLLAAGLAASAVAGLVIAGLGAQLRPWHDLRPAVAIEHAEGPLAGRTLFVSATSRGPAFRFVGRETGGPARDLPPTVSSDEGAASGVMVSALLDGSEPATSAVALRGLAVGFVVVDEALGPDLARTLDATQGLVRLAPRDGRLVWRVTPDSGAMDTPIGPPRVRLVDGDGSTSVPVSGSHSTLTAAVTGGAGSLLVVGEARDWARAATVTLDGRELTAEPGPSQPATTEQRAGTSGTNTVTYRLPRAGTLDIALERGPAWLPAAQLTVILVLVFLAIPFGSRESRRRS